MSFPAVDQKAWRARVEAELAGESFETSLVTRTLEGLAIAPLYGPDDRPTFDSAVPGWHAAGIGLAHAIGWLRSAKRGVRVEGATVWTSLAPQPRDLAVSVLDLMAGQELGLAPQQRDH